jgi:DMSO/TMAO reductase YedYZ heme-binding membrane subunit
VCEPKTPRPSCSGSGYASRVSKRAGFLKAAVTVVSLLPALDLWRDLQKLNRQWVTAYDYPVFSTGILVTGVWACIFLLIALAASPLHRILRMRWPAELRRTLGLIAFLYACLHLAFYIVVGQKFRFDYVWADAFLVKSRLPGWGAFILLLPLAVTSTDGMLRWLGGKAWKRLHLLVFPAMALAIWHMSLTAGEHGQEDFHLSHNALIAFAVLIALRLLLQLQRWVFRKRARDRSV